MTALVSDSELVDLADAADHVGWGGAGMTQREDLGAGALGPDPGVDRRVNAGRPEADDGGPKFARSSSVSVYTWTSAGGARSAWRSRSNSETDFPTEPSATAYTGPRPHGLP
jgi:hypothetical protein